MPRINPRDRESEPKFYAQARMSGEVSLREMCDRIQQSCTVTKADVHAVLVAMEDVFVDALKGGEIIRLGDLGTFRVSLSSKGSLTEKEYTSSLITKSRIIFRPGSVLSDALTNLSFSKLTEKKEDDEEAEEEPGDETTGGEAA